MRTEAEIKPGVASLRLLTTFAWVAAGCLFAVLLIPLVSGRVFTLYDLSAFYLPLRSVYQNALAEGHTVLWTPMLFGGFYMHAEGQLGALHPVHLLLYTALPLTVAFNLETILSYVFGFAGMWLLLRRFGLGPVARVIGATGFAFSGFSLLHLNHINAVAVIAHIPWLVLAFELALHDSIRKRRIGLTGISLLLASQILIGYPQYVWISALICLLYLIVLGHGAPMGRIALSSVASVAGVLLGGIQLLPTFDLLTHSNRTTIRAGFNLLYSLHPLNLAQFFSPYLLTGRVYAAHEERMGELDGRQYFIDPSALVIEFGIYTGAICTLALLWCLLRHRQLPAVRVAWFGGVLCLSGLVLALGRYGFVYEHLAALPLLGKFRAPSRHIVLVHFGLALLTAIMVEDLWRIQRHTMSPRVLRWLWLPFAASVVIGAVAWAWPNSWTDMPGQSINAVGVLVGTLIMLASTLLLLDAARGSRQAIIAIAILFAADLGVWGHTYNWQRPLMSIPELSSRADVPPAQPGARVHNDGTQAVVNLPLLRNFSVVRPFVALAPARELPLSTDAALRVAGVQWVNEPPEGWRQVSKPAARVRVVREAAVADDVAVALKSIDIERTVVVREPLPPLTSTAAAVRLISDEPGRIIVEASTDGTTLLATTEAYDDGWIARREDRTLTTLRIYGDYLGVLLEPGTYAVTLTFEPASMRAGALASSLGLILTILVVAFPSLNLHRAKAGVQDNKTAT